MVTHDPEEAISICDKVAVMNEGKIHQIDTPFKLLENPQTLFVSSFILGNNIISLNKKTKSYFSCLGDIKGFDMLINSDIKFISISPKFLSLNSSKNNNSVVVSREFFGEYFVYKVSINDETLRVRTDISKVFDIGDKCNISFSKDSYCYLYPGGKKHLIN